MNILYLIGAYGRSFLGNEVHEEIGVRCLRRGHGFAVATVAGGSRQDLQDSAEAGISVQVLSERPGAHWVRALSERVFHYSRYVEVWFAYRRALRKYGGWVDLVHAEGVYPLGVIAELQRGRAGVPVVMNIQGADIMSYPEVDYGYGRFRLPALLTRRALGTAAAVRANSELTAVLAERLGSSPRRVQVILRNIGDQAFPPPGTDLPSERRAARAEVAAELGLEGQPLVVSVSRLHPFKGVDDLVRAAAEVSRRAPGTRIVICGPGRTTESHGDYRAYLERLVRDLGVGDTVVFAGELPYPRVKRYLAAADLLVVPSVVDALNKVVVEAAAYGTPAIVTRTSGVSTYVARAECGLVVEPRSPGGLASAICQLLENTPERERLGARAEDLARSFTSDRVAGQLLDLYARALAEAGSP